MPRVHTQQRGEPEVPLSKSGRYNSILFKIGNSGGHLSGDWRRPSRRLGFQHSVAVARAMAAWEDSLVGADVLRQESETVDLGVSVALD